MPAETAAKTRSEAKTALRHAIAEPSIFRIGIITDRAERLI
jgi:hypothetical protein